MPPNIVFKEEHMDILVNVANQKLKIATNLKSLVAGTQEFVRFVFNLTGDWDNLLTFAQFQQNGVAYNQYLDDNNAAYLPSEIVPGSCTVILYGSNQNTIATTNYLTLFIDENILVANAQSTEISQSLYQQLVTRVNTLITWNEQSAADLIEVDRDLQSQINTKAAADDLTAEIARAKAAEKTNADAIALKASQSEVDELNIKVTQLENNEVVANLIQEAVESEMNDFLESGALANLTIADNSITRSKVNAAFEATLTKADTAMQPSVYDPQGLKVDIYSYAQGRADTVQNNLNTVKTEIQDAYILTDTVRYTKLGDAIRGAVTLSRNYAQALLADYKAFTVTIVDELPIAGEPQTFYLVPKASGNGYDKYWYITNSVGDSVWDVFGGSSTLVVNRLPAQGEEDIDYILQSAEGCLYYKWINGVWQVVAGSIADVVSSLPATGNEFTDYYCLMENGVYVHYRWINGAFHSIGTETYSSDELDNMLESIRADIDRNASDIETNATNIIALNNTLNRVAQDLDNLDTEGYQYYATMTQNDQGNYVYSLYETKNGAEEVKSQFVLPSGGGGSGSTVVTNLVVDRITTSPIICTPTDNVTIQIDYSSTDQDGELIDGTYILRSGSQQVMTGSLVQGRNSFDITEYCTIGTQKFTLTVTDEGGSVNVKTWTVQIVDVRLESSFNDRYTNAIGRAVNFTYTPYGSVSKTVHFILDGVELESVTTTASGTLQSYSIPAQSHGAHLLECYITATINNMQVETDHIYKDIIWYDENSTTPIIACIYRYDHYGNVTAKQYNTTSIPYVVYDPTTSTPTVSLSIDGEVDSTLKLTNPNNTWSYKTDEVALHTLVITCRGVSLTIKMNIVELGYDITPITANLEFDFNPVGLSNNSVNRLWQDSNHSDVKLTVSDNFDWNNGGYQVDDDGNQYFLVKSGSRAYISYNLFANDPKQNGAEFKIIFKTSNVRNKDTTFLSCIPTEDDIKVGLKMNVHEAYLNTSTNSLYSPYSEDDRIEFEYNINPLDTENNESSSYIMTYEDGVGARPMIYDSSHRIYQYHPVPITIGSDDCDVAIYRMKAYSSFLTDSNILSNFIADSLDSDTMISRYERNQIYDENNALTPESVANACPNLRVIKIDCPHFTNDKKDYVKNTNVECIYKNGDPILDNWRFVNGYHAGQGTTSNEYGYAARNIDIIFGFDGQHQVVSKIALDPNYVSELTLGDGTKYLDGSGKVSLTRNSVPNDWFNLKVNVASSENANNALLQKRYNDYIPYTIPANRRDPNTKNSMEFVNCVIFIKESDPDLTSHREFRDTNWHFYAIGNIGDSKKTDNTRVNDPTDLKEFVVEVSDNTLPNSTFQTGVYLDSNGNATFDPTQGVEMVYPITTSQWNDSRNLKKASLYDNWDDSFEFRYDMGTKDGETISSAEIEQQQEESKQVWRNMYEWVITSTDSNFVSQLGNWFITESLLYWYLFTERYTMIDNRAKNTFWHWGKTYISESEAIELGDNAEYYTIDNAKAAINNGYRFDLWDYDNDTAIGINNSGELTMTYGKEDIDYKEDGNAASGYIFNAAESVLWRRIRNLMYSQLQAMYLSRESLGCWSATSLINEFDAWQNQFPEELWRLDIERKYLRTYQGGGLNGGNDPTPTPRFLQQMMNGRKRYQRRQFERDMEAYIGTKYVGTTVRADQIMFRCNTPKTGVVVTPDYTLRIVPYSDMYLTVLYGNSPAPVQIRAKAGVEYELETNLTEMDDTAILIYCASRIQELNDLSACYIHDNDFSKASKLKTLIIGSTVSGYQNTFLTTLNMGENTLLETLDIRNCPNLTGSVNLSSCANLINFYAEGSVITSVQFASNGKIVHAHLPATINSLTFRYLNYLTDLQIASYANLETFISEYSIVDSLSIIQQAINTLQTLRVLGVDWTLPTTNVLNNILKMNSSMLSGYVYVSGQIRNNELVNYANAWSDLTVEYDSSQMVTQYLATFVNSDGTVLYTEYVDRGSTPTDPVSNGDIPTPTKESTAQYNFTYTGWDDIVSDMLNPRTITAQYSQTVRKYTINWYARAGLLLDSVQADYGSEVVYSGDTPTNDSEEGAYIYNVFAGWDKSTGYIRGDLDVYAVWDRGALPSTSKDLKDMSCAEIYGICTAGLAQNYFEDKDYVDIELGSDFTFSNIESEVLLENRYFDGTNYVDTNIKLFNADAPSFTLAVEYEFLSSNSSDATLVSCFEETGSEGFRLRYSAANPNIQWGDRNVTVGYGANRNIVVLRHIQGMNNLFVYAFNNAETTYALSGVTSEMVRTRSTNSEQVLSFGAVRFIGDGGHDYYAKGWVHWAKIWYDDLGDAVAKKLASWTHDIVRFEFSGANRYRLAGTTSQRANASFYANNLLPMLRRMNPGNTNANGWDGSEMRTFISTRVYNAFPYKWQAAMKLVKISASAGNQSSEIIVSNDYVYLPAIREVGGSSSEPYASEGEPISFLNSNANRIKFNGIIRADNATIITEASDPTQLSSYNVKEGDIWINTNNSSVGYYYIPATTVAKHSKINWMALNSSDCIMASDGGCWVRAYLFWLRSPYVSHTTYFWLVSSYGGLGNPTASTTIGLCLGFSI